MALTPGGLTPALAEALTRLGAWLPFERAVDLLDGLIHTRVSEPTARRRTQQAGAAYEATQTAEVAHLERETPLPPVGPAKQLLSVDGAMVPLVGGEWAEVKTLVLGGVEPPVMVEGERVVRTRDLSYFSRLAEAEMFQRLALVETHRRGVETAGQVGAVTDGAEWIQGFIDFHRSDAQRILDFAHPAERVSQCAQAVLGEGTPQAQQWLAQQLHTLKHEGPCGLLAELRTWQQAHPELDALAEHVAYLEKREAHMAYPAFQAQGWPIGSGAVESGNKVVVEARLKGAGMHWARAHVNPMLALRNAVCNERWPEAWARITDYQRQLITQQRRTLRQARQAPPVARPIEALAPALPRPPQPQPSPKAPSAPLPWRPAPNHPWRRSPIGRAKYLPAKV